MLQADRNFREAQRQSILKLIEDKIELQRRVYFWTHLCWAAIGFLFLTTWGAL